MTPLDLDHRAMEAAPDDEGPRRAFFGRLAGGELFLLCGEEPRGPSVLPEILDLESGRFLAVFDRADRLAAFVPAAAPYVALPARAILEMSAGQELGWALNLGVAPSSMLIGADGVDWMRSLGAPAAAGGRRPTAVTAPRALPAALPALLESRLSSAAGLARAVYLGGARYADGTDGTLLAIEDALPAAETALAGAAAAAIRASGAEADIVFLPAGHPVLARLARVGLRLDLPTPQKPADPVPPGTDPSKPPRLR